MPVTKCKNVDILVSIIIPVYNTGRTLDRALVSAYYQTYKNIEIIVIDDGSTDKFTRLKLKSLDDHRVKIIFKENGGVSNSRNTGISYSSGEYILPLDSDDFMHSSYVEECISLAIHNKNLSPIYCDTIHCRKLKCIEKRPEWSKEAMLNETFVVSCSMFSREAFDSAGGYDEVLKGWEDYDLWLRMMQKGYEGKRIPKPLFVYFHPENKDTISTIANLHRLSLHMKILIKNGLIVDIAKKVLESDQHLVPLDIKPVTYSPQTDNLTILCSNYNSARWINGYLNAINKQLLKRFSVIFVDANSSDDSLKVIEKFRFRDGITKKIIRLKQRVTVYEAWNIAIKNSSTEYIINFNTDDRLFSGALLTLSNAMMQNPEVDIAYANSLISEDEQHTTIKEIQSWPNYTHQILLDNCILGPFPIVKRSTIIESGLFNPTYTISGDYEMWLRLSKRGCNFLKVNDYVGSYYHNPQGVSTDPSIQRERLRQDLEIRRLYM